MRKTATVVDIYKNDISGRIIKIARRCAMGMNVEKIK
jgi:hypothetical protein